MWYSWPLVRSIELEKLFFESIDRLDVETLIEFCVSLMLCVYHEQTVGLYMFS